MQSVAFIGPTDIILDGMGLCRYDEHVKTWKWVRFMREVYGVGVMMLTKLRVQAQHLQPGDIVGSGEKVLNLIINSIHWPSSQVCVRLEKRDCIWGKYTMINIQREE